jgi:hypothetical protein
MSPAVATESIPRLSSQASVGLHAIVLPSFLHRNFQEWERNVGNIDPFAKGYPLYFSPSVTLYNEQREIIGTFSDGRALAKVAEDSSGRILRDLHDTMAREDSCSKSRSLYSLMCQANSVEDLLSAVAKNVNCADTSKHLFRFELPNLRAVSLEAALLVLSDSTEKVYVANACTVIACALLRDAHVDHPTAEVSIRSRMRTFNTLFNKIFLRPSEKKDEVQQLIVDAVKRECANSRKYPQARNLQLLGEWC